MSESPSSTSSGNSGAKKRALVALTRKLSILMLKLWRDDEEFVAYPNGAPATAA